MKPRICPYCGHQLEVEDVAVQLEVNKMKVHGKGEPVREISRYTCPSCGHRIRKKSPWRFYVFLIAVVAFMWALQRYFGFSKELKYLLIFLFAPILRFVDQRWITFAKIDDEEESKMGS